MNESLKLSFSYLFGLALVIPLSACGGSEDDPGGGTGGGGGTTTGNVMLVPDETGWIDAMAANNTIGVQGAWYPYGDAYGDPACGGAKCLAVGMHTAAECSVITNPDPALMSFPNTGGMMCTSGTIAQVIAGPDGMPDYSNIWGAGIGVDLAGMAGAGECDPKPVWDAIAHGVTGISFKIDMVPLTGLRVEFPMPATEGHTDGSDYWGATMNYPPSPVMAGVNVVKWDQVTGPRGIPFDPTQMLAVQFHAPAATSAAGTYSFCISELTFLTQ